MGNRWKKIVGTVAPGIATALGGPLAGLAVRAISGAILGHPDGSEEDVEAAMLGATPDQLLALKKAEQDFQVQMRELDVNLERISADDRASARQREVALKDWTPKMLAGGVVFGFFATLYWVLTHGIAPDAQSILILVGGLATGLGQVLNYYFGSSVGSKRKTELLGGRQEK